MVIYGRETNLSEISVGSNPSVLTLIDSYPESSIGENKEDKF
jgi:hypothetical protein